LSLEGIVRRRQFLTVLGGATACPFIARAQQARLPTIGYLGASAASTESPWTAAFVQRLGELGWVEGSTIAIEYRWGEGRSERYAEVAAEFVRRKVDVIVAPGSAVSAVKHATSTIPIVFPIAGDPIGAGLVASLGRPGGNATGLSLQLTDVAGKRLELLREIVPSLRRLAIVADASFTAMDMEMREVQAMASALGFDVVTSEIRRAEDIAPAIESFKGRTDALYVAGGPLVNANRVRISILAVGARLPAMYAFREIVAAGGLMSYGPNYPDLFRRAADYVAKILHGAKPGDLPVEQPTKFDLVINLTTAKAIGLNIPEAFLLRADEVIE
jgi:putative ABC transport system substrate-binding protein